MPVVHRAAPVLVVLAAALAVRPAAPILTAQSDLDGFMRQVMERRDDNWRRLQQYILDEREQVEVRGPGGLPLWGERRTYTWYIRDGFFIRSPLEVNGAEVGEDDRRSYEARFLRREQMREKRARENPDQANAGDSPGDIDGFIRQTREPQFVTSAYFLRFKFDQGRYAFVGPETLDGRETLKVEYYPTLLFTDTDDDNRRQRRRTEVQRANEEQIRTLLNKGSRITLWVLPELHQIVRYNFNNIDLDFFPAQWLVSVNSVTGSMTMTEPFEGVWLPDGLEIDVDLMFAFGPLDVRYELDYYDYRQAEVTSTIRIPEPR